MAMLQQPRSPPRVESGGDVIINRAAETMQRAKLDPALRRTAMASCASFISMGPEKAAAASMVSLCCTPCGSAAAPPPEDGKKPYVGILDIFKVGIGPSSSHTMGPMTAGADFAAELAKQNMLEELASVEISLFGSLALTGKGHATDKAAVLGLMGFRPHSTDPDEADKAFKAAVEEQRITLPSGAPIRFDYDEHVKFFMDVELPFHPNGMTFTAFARPAPTLETTTAAAGDSPFDSTSTMTQTPTSASRPHSASPQGGEADFFTARGYPTRLSSQEYENCSLYNDSLQNDPLLEGDECAAGCIASSPTAASKWADSRKAALFSPSKCVLLSQTYYSVGGGFIKTEQEMLEELNKTSEGSFRAHPPHSHPASHSSAHPQQRSEDKEVEGQQQQQFTEMNVVPYLFTSAQELMQLCKEHRLSIAEVMMRNECALRSWAEDDVNEQLDHIVACMRACVDRGLRVTGKMPVSNMPRRAAAIKRRLEVDAAGAPSRLSATDPLVVTDWIGLFARAVNEENACGGRVVTSPTNGAAGTLPAVLEYYCRFRSDPNTLKTETRRFIATAAAIGYLCKRNASISGAEAGCQAEVGSACAMAAAGLAAVSGATEAQIENAAEIGLEHCLGLTCDPINGLVQIPCIERNAVAAVKAVTACRLALLGDGEHEVSLDSCIRAMYHTGADMQTKYRETSLGGLAAHARKGARLL